MKTQNGIQKETKRLMVIIEHVEPFLGRWIWLEYKHASKIVGRHRLRITNIKSRKEAAKLREIAKVSQKSISEILGSRDRKTIILDPQSPVPLTPDDFTSGKCILIGGILGDHPPRGRTRFALTQKMPNLKSRNLGSQQFSVDGAVYVALEVASGKTLSEIPIRLGIEISTNERHSTYLPFAYPLVGGKPLIAPELREYIRKGIFKDEETLFKTGRSPK